MSRFIEKYESSQLKEEYNALIEDIFIHEYRETVEIWTLIPMEQWTSYVILEITGLHEQLHLEKALRTLKHVFVEKVLRHEDKQKRVEKDITSAVDSA